VIFALCGAALLLKQQNTCAAMESLSKVDLYPEPALKGLGHQSIFAIPMVRFSSLSLTKVRKRMGKPVSIR
jgi:hypothetical protein